MPYPSLLVSLQLWTASAAPFDPGPAWDEYEETLRGVYAYVDRPWLEAHLDRMEAAARATESAEAFRRVLHQGSLAFADPHVLVGPLDDADPNVWPTSADLVLAVVDGVPTITDVRRDSAAAAHGLRPGQAVVAVDGGPLTPDRIYGPLVPDPTPEQVDWAVTLLANGRRAGARRLTVVREGGEAVVELPSPRELARRVSDRPPLTVSRHGEVCVLRPENSLGDLALVAAVDAALSGCSPAAGLILDLRNTPSGGNTDVARGIMGHFVSEVQGYQVHEIPAIERRTTVPRRFVEQVVPRSPRFMGQVVVLGGAWTGSMGEGLVIGMDALGAHTIARDMGDLLGALHTFPMAHSTAVVELGAEALFHVDGTPRADFVADHPLAAADTAPDGSDPGLAAALAWLAAH